MKTVGILGGLGPESTIEYYRFLIAKYRAMNPDGSYPSIVINSIDVGKVLSWIGAGELEVLTKYLSAEVDRLAAAGAAFGAIAANTPHIVFDEVQRRSPIPLLSIVQAACDAAESAGLKRLGLLSTRFTMQASFYPQVFSQRGISLVVPEAAEQDYIHDKYVNELLKGVILPETRKGLLAIVDRMQEQQKIQAVILGGTELPLILRDAGGSRAPFLDTTQIHVARIVKELLS